MHDVFGAETPESLAEKNFTNLQPLTSGSGCPRCQNAEHKL